MVNKKAERIAQLLEVELAKARAAFEAAGSYARDLERLTLEEEDTLSLEEWGRLHDLAEKVQAQRTVFLQALGGEPPLPPAASEIAEQILGGAVRREGAKS